MVQRIFEDSGDEVVVEEYLDGQEISIHAISDGRTYKMFPASQDHKPIGDGDIGKITQSGYNALTAIHRGNSDSPRAREWMHSIEIER